MKEGYVFADGYAYPTYLQCIHKWERVSKRRGHSPVMVEIVMKCKHCGEIEVAEKDYS